jgi:D-2-hydroxyacid dehydrogenase (NADP+)
LKQKVIAGAGLDVFASDPGPLPPESKLWELENLIITPHNAGQRPDYSELIIRQFCLNLKRYIRGRELVYQVNKQLGY